MAKLQPGLGFRLNDGGSWQVAEVPEDVAASATYSGDLNIEGYRCVVFDAPDGTTWAQKAQGTMASLRQIAARIARSG